ncbi:MAG: hypothetical protein RI498_07550, partial [Spiribacter sp.]|nr:hypothetical protein [Spiribacter sp.]
LPPSRHHEVLSGEDERGEVSVGDCTAIAELYAYAGEQTLDDLTATSGLNDGVHLSQISASVRATPGKTLL